MPAANNLGIFSLKDIVCVIGLAPHQRHELEAGDDGLLSQDHDIVELLDLPFTYVVVPTQAADRQGWAVIQVLHMASV